MCVGPQIAKIREVQDVIDSMQGNILSGSSSPEVNPAFFEFKAITTRSGTTRSDRLEPPPPKRLVGKRCPSETWFVITGVLTACQVDGPLGRLVY